MDENGTAPAPAHVVAAQLRRDGRLEAARELLEQHCRSRPGDLHARYLLALVRRDLDDPAGAAVAIRPLLEMPQESIQYLAGLIAAELDLDDRAVGRLRRAVVCDPAHWGAWRLLVALSPSDRRAVAWALAAAVSDPGSGSGWIDAVCLVLISGSGTVPANVSTALAELRLRGGDLPIADTLPALMPDWRATEAGREWAGLAEVELVTRLRSIQTRLRSSPAVVRGLTRRLVRMAIWSPQRRSAWLGLLTLSGERARPGESRLVRAAARVVAFGGLLEDTAVAARPFDGCVKAKVKAIAAEERDAPAAVQVAHALGLHALCERVGRPIDLQIMPGRRQVAIGDRRIAYCARSESVVGFTAVLFLFEPGLWRWMAGFRPDDVLLDVGANVGIYTIAAAGLFGVRVAALEPYGPNLAMLRRNVALNRLAERVTVLPIAATDVERRGRLYHEGGEAGAASQHFESAEDGADGSESFDRVEGVPVDTLVERGTIPFPTRIKIDVDGNEWAVIEGMTRTLADPRLHSVRLEVRWTRPEGRAVVERVESFGFRAAIDDDAKNLLFTRVKLPSKTG